MALLLSTAVNVQAQWVTFSGGPDAPSMNIITSNSYTVTFEVDIPGIYATDTVVKGTAFTRLALPGGGAVNPVGHPEIPVKY